MITTAKSLAYLCFLLIGLAVFRLQHVIIFESDADLVASNVLATVAFVGMSCFVALVAAFRAGIKEILLIVLLTLTGVLAVFQFGPIPHSTLNTYARVYAAVCIYISLWKLVSSFWEMGRVAKVVVVVVFVLFALFLLFYLLVLQIEAGVRLT